MPSHLFPERLRHCWKRPRVDCCWGASSQAETRQRATCAGLLERPGGLPLSNYHQRCYQWHRPSVRSHLNLLNNKKHGLTALFFPSLFHYLSSFVSVFFQIEKYADKNSSWWLHAVSSLKQWLTQQPSTSVGRHSVCMCMCMCVYVCTHAHAWGQHAGEGWRTIT